MMMAIGVDYVAHDALANLRMIADGKAVILISVLHPTGQMTAHKIGLDR